MPNRTVTIGVLSPVTGGFYYGTILAGITREVAAVGGRVVLMQTLDAGLSSDEIVAAPEFSTPTGWDHVGGVISIATAVQRPYLDRLRAAGKPVVLASDAIDGFDVASVVPDNVSGVTAAVDHLVEHGHTRIGFAANLVQTDMRERHGAYRTAMVANGLDPDPAWLFVASDNGELGGRNAARRIVAAGLPVTALVTATDRNAIGCLAELAESGVAVPDELAVVGFDGVEAGAHTQPPLTTVRQRFDELGATAARLLLAQLRGETVECRAHVSPSQFVRRQSCGCAGDDAGATPTDEIERWRAEAGRQRERSTRRELLIREQYEIGTMLLDHQRVDPRRLDWLAATDVRGAYLGLWDGDRDAGRLRIAGVYDPHSALQRLVGSTVPIGRFPPACLVGLADPTSEEMTIVVPVRARGLDFGLLAVVGEVDAMSATGRETHNQWAALLTAALEQQDLIENVRTSEERFSLWALATNDGLWDWDLTKDTVYYSGRAMEILGHRHHPTSGSPSLWFDTVHPDDVEDLRRALRLGATTGRIDPLGIEHRVRGADGDYRCMSCKALPIGPPGGAAERIVGSLHDIEPRKRLEEQLRQGALYDEVTGLANRKLFLERLSVAITAARHTPNLRYAVVFLDLDGFKLVNDSLGHLAGDRLLTQIGDRLRAGLRDADLAARFGGDEFAILLHDVDARSVGTIIERMQATLAAPMDLNGHQVAVTASVGVTTSAGGYSNAEDVLRDADIAMYHAKALHGGACAMFDVDMHAGAVTRLGLQSELRQALDRRQFEVHYQPIVDVDATRTERLEALVRWRHPTRGLLPPMEFLPAMEEASLMVTLGRWIIDEVCRQIAIWQCSYDGAVNVSVNVSNREFWDAGLLAHILETIARHGLTPANLTLEITESVIMRKPEVARLIIEELHAAGISVELDDFGTGTSSLHALHRFPVRALKIDRSFIHELDTDSRTTELVQIIIAMGQALGVDVVAEGVETVAQLELLRAMGCHNVQGFCFTRAVDGHAAAELLGRRLPVREAAASDADPPIAPEDPDPAHRNGDSHLAAGRRSTDRDRVGRLVGLPRG